MTPRQQYYSTELGSVVGTPLALFWQHVGILVPTGPYELGRSVISFSEEVIVKQPVEQFAKGQHFSSVAYLGNLPPAAVVQRAEWALAHREYHSMNFNCDYFVRYCHGVKEESPQASATAALALSGLCFGLAVAASK